MQKCEERAFADEAGTLQVKTTQLPALRAFRLLSRLGKLLGPSLGKLRGVGLKSDASALTPAIAALADSLDPDQIEALAVQILEGTLVVDGKQARTLNTAAAIDDVFGGRLMTMFKVMAFAIEVNFRDFFRALPVPTGAPEIAPSPAPALDQ